MVLFGLVVTPAKLYSSSNGIQQRIDVSTTGKFTLKAQVITYALTDRSLECVRRVTKATRNNEPYGLSKRVN